MRQLLSYFVADETDELELEKQVKTYERLGYDRVGGVIEKHVEGTKIVIYMQALAQYKEDRNE